MFSNKMINQSYNDSSEEHVSRYMNYSHCIVYMIVYYVEDVPLYTLGGSKFWSGRWGENKIS
jgi:hypothetical protein